ncbi:MAG: thrombospondin type 3 repeat-containing protein [Pseudomonadota bacterium]
MKKTRRHQSGKRSTALTAVAIACLLAGCDAQAPVGQLVDNNLNLQIPDKIRQVAAVNLANVTATATVNNQSFPMNLSGDRYIATISLEQTNSLNIAIEFTEQLDNGATIRLVNAQRVIAVDSNRITADFSEDDFNDSFDDDSDGLTNLQERNLGTDPTTFTTFRETRELTLTFNTPAAIPNPLVTQPRVLFDGIPRGISQSGLTYTSSGVVTTLQEVEVEVRMSQQISSGRVVLAESISTVAAGFDDSNINLNDNDFDFSRDDDGDGITNLIEVRDGTDPFTAN